MFLHAILTPADPCDPALHSIALRVNTGSHLRRSDLIFQRTYSASARSWVIRLAKVSKSVGGRPIIHSKTRGEPTRP